MDGETDVTPDEQTTETVKEEQRVPTNDERMEHLYGEIGTLRAEIAELRSHSHAELAHATHEHGEYARHDHQHDLEKSGGTTEPLAPDDEPEPEGDATPRPVHPYFRRVKLTRG